MGNGEQGTGNVERKMSIAENGKWGNGERGTGNGQWGNKEWGTGNGEQDVFPIVICVI